MKKSYRTKDTSSASATPPPKRLASKFAPASLYRDWERDPIWQTFLKTQSRFNRPRTSKVNNLMLTVPNGTRKEFLRRLNRVNKCQSAIDFERHALGVSFAMERLSTMVKRRKKHMRLSSEPLRINHLDGYMGYSDEDTPPRSKALTIVDNFTLFKDDKPFIYKAKYTPVRQFGEINENAKEPHSDYNQLLKYNEAVEQGMICGAAIEIRGLIAPDFLDWACGTSVFERSDIPHVQLIYNLPLPSGAEYRFTFKKVDSLTEELHISNEENEYTEEDQAIIDGIENALDSGNQLQLTAIMTGQGVFSEKGALKQQFQSFTCPAREEELKDPEYYDNYLAMMRTGIWRRAASITPEAYNHNQDTVFSPENEHIEHDLSALEKRIDDFQKRIREDPNSPFFHTYATKTERGSSEYQREIRNAALQFAKNIARARAVEDTRHENEDDAATLKQTRLEKGWEGPDGGYELALHHIMLDSIINIRKGSDSDVSRSYENAETRFMSMDGVLDLIDSRADETNRTLSIYDPVKTEGSKRTFTDSISADRGASAQKRAIRANIKTVSAYIAKAENGEVKLRPGEKNRLKERSNALKLLQSELANSGQLKMRATQDIIEEARALGVKKLPPEHPLLAKREALINAGPELEMRLWEQYDGLLDKNNEDRLLQKVFVQERNIIKLIYAIDDKGQIKFDEEKQLDAGAIGRASHSELVGGGNVFGAGELIFEKPPGSKNWRMIEINNGSGHYRPPSDTLRYVANCLIDNLGKAYEDRGHNPDQAEQAVHKMMSKARLTDTIARGITLRDQERDLRKKMRPATKTAKNGAPSQQGI